MVRAEFIIEASFRQQTGFHMPKNTPLWGSLYQIDFDAIRQINMPGLILGPWGKDFHKMTERVNIRSLTREYPCVLEAVSRKVWGI